MFSFSNLFWWLGFHSSFQFTNQICTVWVDYTPEVHFCFSLTGFFLDLLCQIRLFSIPGIMTHKTRFLQICGNLFQKNTNISTFTCRFKNIFFCSYCELQVNFHVCEACNEIPFVFNILTFPTKILVEIKKPEGLGFTSTEMF